MKRTTAANSVANKFADAVPGTSAGTHLGAADLNEHQEEIATAVERSHTTLATMPGAPQLADVIVGSRELTQLIGFMGARTSGSQVFRDACLGPAGRVVLVGDAGTIVTTDNLSTLTARTPASSYTGVFNAVCFTGSFYVAIGDSGEVQRSVDAITWTHVIAGLGSTTLRYLIDTGGGKLFAIGSGFPVTVAISTDHGATWTARADLSGFNAAGAVYRNGRLLIAGNTGVGNPAQTLRYSDNDGVSFTFVNLTSVLPAGGNFSNLLPRDGYYSLVAYNLGWGATFNIYGSADNGLTWVALAPALGNRMAAGRFAVITCNVSGVGQASFDGVSYLPIAIPASSGVTVSDLSGLKQLRYGHNALWVVFRAAVGTFLISVTGAAS